MQGIDCREWLLPFSKSITLHKAFLNQPSGKSEQILPCVTFIFKGTTLNKQMCLGYESLRLPETSIFKWNGYMQGWPIVMDMHNAGWYDSTMQNGQLLFYRAAILWFILTGFFWIVFGLTLQKAVTKGFIPPASLGWSFIILGILIAVIIPISGACFFIIQGVILVNGCKRIPE